MLSGFLVLIGLCGCEIIIAKLVIKDKAVFLMDIDEFFDWNGGPTKDDRGRTD
ncbi:hypothetical protein [Sediminibacillus albus]|uniref:Uncharacterized protein n=1 Tax=Sediminibacillus albus TaxID=407036 RepID=A0A1G8WJU5_9BACI|nr:hypothetical protein [Sediminibacillus albus]SDJ78343.1 hypothetical protein SAMN05216243_0837 [Sediminibacillus albus]